MKYYKYFLIKFLNTYKILSVIIENHRAPIKSEQCEIKVYPSPTIEHLIVHIYIMTAMFEQFRRRKIRNPDPQRSCVKNRNMLDLYFGNQLNNFTTLTHSSVTSASNRLLLVSSFSFKRVSNLRNLTK